MSPVRSVTYVSGMDHREMVGATGFEPATTRTPSVCATRLRYAPMLMGLAGAKHPPQLWKSGLPSKCAGLPREKLGTLNRT